MLAIKAMLSTGCRIGALANMTISGRGKWTAESKGKTHTGTFTDKSIARKVNIAIGKELFTDTPKLTVYIKRAMNRDGITGGGHMCRHRYALDLYKATGNDPEQVRKALGHSDLKITTAYLQGLSE